MAGSLLSRDLLQVARGRLDGSLHSEANLRRATSDLYYAMFHAICEALAEALRTDQSHPAFRDTYSGIYRTVSHASAEQQCKIIAKKTEFSDDFRTFAEAFVAQRNKRETADYDPLAVFVLSSVMLDLQLVETRIARFWSAPAAERALFACSVGLRRGK